MAQAEQYFAAEPQSKDVRKTLHVTLRGNEADVEVSNGVFSGNRVDLGTSVLLRQAPEPPEEGTFLDLGCGWGPIALALGFASPKADIWALDVNERALELTRRNAELNGITNAEFYAADAGLFMENAAQNGQRPDVVFMDPPRAGSSIKFLKSLLKTAPEKIVYISCNPETMARDLAFLTEDYAVDKLCPVDMFPHTEHVECVSVLHRKSLEK